MKDNENRIIKPIFMSGFGSQISMMDGLFGRVLSLFLYISNGCDNDCIFCRRKYGQPSFLSELRGMIRENLKHHIRKLTLVGNEVLSYPHIFSVLESARNNFFQEVEIMTSGNRLSDFRFAERLVDAGVTSFSFPIFSLSARLHDAITQRKGSFYEVMRALRNLARLREHKRVQIYLHTNLLKQNITSIKALTWYAHKVAHIPFCVFPIRPKSSHIAYKDLMPTYSEIVKHFKGNDIPFVGFPLCIVERVSHTLLLAASSISDSMKIYLLDQNFKKTKKCRTCRFLSQCMGVFDEYLTLYSDKELKALP